LEYAAGLLGTNDGSWRAKPEEVIAFLDKAKEMELLGANFWEFRNTLQFVPECWEVIADYSWNGTTLPPEDPEYVEITARLAELTSVVTSRLRIREGPGINYEIVGHIYQSDRFYSMQTQRMSDGNIWLNIGHKQWCAMFYNGEAYVQWVRK
jgi:hypothetical protein